MLEFHLAQVFSYCLKWSEFTNAIALMCPGNIISLNSLNVFGSDNVSALFLSGIPEPMDDEI